MHLNLTDIMPAAQAMPEYLASFGVPRSGRRAADLKTPFRGVRVPVNWGDDPVSLARAFSVKMSPLHFFSHATAAILHGMRIPLAMRQQDVIHVMSNEPGRPPRDKRVRGHVGSATAMEINGLRMTNPVTTWCLLGAVLGLEELVIAADGLVRRKSPVATMAQLQQAVAGWRGARGYRNLLAALEDVRERTDSARETMLRLLLVRNGLPEPMVNAPIRNRTGRVVAHADLAYPDVKLVVEYDGDQHRTDHAQYYIDVDRLEKITREGWRVIRVNQQHMREPRKLASLVRQALVDSAWIE
jgi:very-short-patch-repair endonuclease